MFTRNLKQITSNPSIEWEEMMLFNQKIGLNEINKLAEILKIYNKLKILNLGSNLINDEGLGVLIESIQNHQLSELYLGGNQIGNEGAKNLANFLKNQPQLKKLYLGGNQIGDEGASLLLEVFENHSLTEFDLSGNQIGDDLMLKIEALSIFD